jgi:hypothetical protein
MHRRFQFTLVVVKQDALGGRVKVVELAVIGHLEVDPDHKPYNNKANRNKDGEHFHSDLS